MAEAPFRLLLVEDNQGDADLARERLQAVEDYQFELIHVSRLQDALNVLDQSRIDGVILDLNLPDSRGVETVRRIRTHRYDVAVVVMSGINDETVRRDVYQCGAQDFIGKDEPPAKLLARSVLYALERHRAQEQQRQIQRVFSALPDAVLIVDNVGVVRFVNEAALKLFDRRFEDFVGELLSFSVIEGEVSEIQIPKRDRMLTCEIRVVHCEWAGQPASLALVRDVTDQRRLADQLRQSTKMEAIGRLAGGVAHDFNNLLTVILGYGDILQRDFAKLGLSKPPLQEILSAGNRAAQLTKQLLAFSRQQVMQPRLVDLNQTVLQMEGMLSRLIGEDVILSFRQPSRPFWIMADPTQVEQVIMNLAINSRDAMPGGGRLTFETEVVELDENYFHSRSEGTPGTYVMLAVSDTGCGMDAETAARIFEPFFTTKEAGKGTGLGLATVFGIVRQSGGNINVYSEPGIGTTFRIYFPHPAEAPADAGDPHSLAASVRGGETVLLVEDNPTVRGLVKTLLEDCGYKVQTSANGLEALNLVRNGSKRIDVLITDLVMPEMDGPALAQAFRNECPGTPVLFVSGYANDSSLRHRMLKPDDHFLAKPFAPEVLARRVREILDHRANRRAGQH